MLERYPPTKPTSPAGNTFSGSLQPAEEEEKEKLRIFLTQPGLYIAPLTASSTLCIGNTVSYAKTGFTGTILTPRLAKIGFFC